jgi:hypothetical protein
MIIQGQVGAPAGTNAPGSTPAIRQGQLGDMIVSELHGRFYEQTYRGGMFRTGTTSVVAGTANHGTSNGGSATLATAAAATPMLGIWNPISSSVNVVLTQATLEAYINTVTTPTSFGALVWYVSLGNAAISTGLSPYNSKTLAASGSQVKGFAGATALTGLSNVFSALEVADFQAGGQAIAYGTIGNTTIVPNMVSVQNFDGQLIVPPGAVLALYNTGASTTFSYSGRLMWEEVPV